MPSVNNNILTMTPEDMAQRHKIRTSGVGVYPIIQLGGTAEGFVQGDFFEVVKGYPTRSRVITFEFIGSAAGFFAPSDVYLVDEGDVMFCTFNATEETWDLDYHRARINSSWKPRPLDVTTYTFNNPGDYFIVGDAGHHNAHFRVSGANNVEVRIPGDNYFTGNNDEWFTNDNNPYSPGPIPEGASILFTKIGAGDVIFAPDGDAVIRCPAGNQPRISVQWGKAMLTKVGPNEWELEGNLPLVETP